MTTGLQTTKQLLKTDAYLSIALTILLSFLHRLAPLAATTSTVEVRSWVVSTVTIVRTSSPWSASFLLLFIACKMKQNMNIYVILQSINEKC